MPQERLHSYKGRRFVLLCGCSSSWTDDRIKFGVQDLEHGDKCTPQVIAIGPRCEKCKLYAWIVLPEGDVYEAPK